MPAAMGLCSSPPQGMLPPLWHPPREQLAVKEQGWNGSLQATVPLGRTKHIKRPGRIANL